MTALAVGDVILFHMLSGLEALLLTPTNLIALVILVGLALSSWSKTSVAGRRLAVGGGVVFVVLAVLPVGDLMLAPLERRFPPVQVGIGPVAGVVVLGGSLSLIDEPDRPDAQPSQAAGRLFEAARLAGLYPTAPVLVSGGPINPASGRSEADAVAAVLIRLGVAPSRIIRERGSADTYQNARFSAAMVHPRPGPPWLLVTSAFHMPRAVGAFRKAGFEVTAAPSDWRANDRFLGASWSASSNLGKVDVASKEYLGLAVYALRRRSNALFPAP